MDSARRRAGVGSRAAATYACVAAALLALLVATGCGSRTPPPPPSSPSPASSAGTTTGTLPPLAHIFVIVMENHAASQIIGSSQAPFINQLATRYSLATDYSAITHPSLPNYIALTSGSTQGITDDRNPPTAGYAVDATNLADRIEASGRTWKLYGESMPSPGYSSNAGSLYAVKHIPFLYYKDILDNAARRDSHVVPFTQLATDLRSATTTPDFAFITPNMCSDMHDCPVSTGDAWLAKEVPQILGSPAFTSTPSLLVITWDEGNDTDNHVATIVAGSGARAGYRSNAAYDHFSLLHTIEADWGLKPLTANDARAATMAEFLRR